MVFIRNTRSGKIGGMGNGNNGLGLGGCLKRRGKVLMAIIVVVAFWNLCKNAPTINYDTNASTNTNDGGNKNTNASASANASANTSSASSATSTTSPYKSNDVLIFDHVAMQNIQETYKGAKSYIEWAPRDLDNIIPTDDLQGQFQAKPLLATIDRRPIIVRKQIQDDIIDAKEAKKPSLTQNGKLMGCAISATTHVSNLKAQYLKHYKEYTPTCDVCFQFSNQQDMDNFVHGVGYEPLQPGQESIATKCFGGKASITARFADWQQKDVRFKGYGYPWTVDCVLPNGIQELTCREISRMQREIEVRDGLQHIYVRTKFVLDGWFDIWSKQFWVHSSWPWTAIMTHDDDRSMIAERLSKSWDDVNSGYVPRNAKELTLAHVEGPGYDKTEFNGGLSLKSMEVDRESKGGLHFRFVSNLFHLMRNAPGSTHMMAVVDGQVRRTYEEIVKLLNSKVVDLYPTHGSIVFDSVEELQKRELIPISRMDAKKGLRAVTDLTLMELLRLRSIKIHLVPITTPSMAFERNVCGGQYSFAPYLAARFAADYQVMMFIDGDTAMVEGSTTLQTVLYDRFFSKNSSKCAGHRLRLIEQFVQPEHENIEGVLQCTQDLSSHRDKWAYAMENCHLKEGHVVARTDSIYAFSVHHPDTLPGYLPKGVEDCITAGNMETDRYFLKESEFVQLHLRDRERKPECTCFVNRQL
jgi:hypothetical protein